MKMINNNQEQLTTYSVGKKENKTSEFCLADELKECGSTFGPQH
jgi:hypothetical protein